MSKEENRQKAYDKWLNDERIYIKHKNGAVSRLTIEYDQCSESPREWDNVCTIASKTGRWNIADKDEAYPFEEFKNKIEELRRAEDAGDMYMRFVYMYDHGGQTISLQPFGDYWDSGVCGVIFVSKGTIFKELLNVTDDNWKERAYKIMENEIEIYNQYIKGEIYGYTLEKAEIIDCKERTSGKEWSMIEWESEDSCCGFYGDLFKSGLMDEAILKEDEILDFKNDGEVIEYLLNN